MNVQDPSKPDYTPFYLMVTGHIQSGLMNDKDGVSQHAYKSQQMNRRIVWNFPFETTFRSFNITGWP